MSNSLQAKPVFLWAVRILSFAAMVVCLVLFSFKLTGRISSLAGCGGEGGCGQVMGGEWSEWFQVPVTVLAAGIYAGILLLTLPSVQRVLGKTGDQLLAAAGVILAGAAVYFLCLLYFKEKQNCPWCLSLHVTGLVVSGLILTMSVKVQREGERGVLEAAMLTGFMAIGLLAAGQVWGPKPETHLITDGGFAGNAGVPATVVGGSEAAKVISPRILEFFGGELKFDAAVLPVLGEPDARVVLVEFFDYTCGSCRDLAVDLKALKKKLPGAISVVVLPAPLNRGCNPWLKDSVKDHPGACELAKIALACWKAKPAAFAELHDFLLTLPLPANETQVAVARRKADDLAGAREMAVAMEDAWVGQRLQENLGTFAKLTTQNIKMPKLLLHTSMMMHGPAKDEQTFISVIEQQFDLAGSGSPVLSPAR